MVRNYVENFELKILNAFKLKAIKNLGEWMDGWMDGWMGGWMDGRESRVKDCLQQSKIKLNLFSWH